MEELKEVERAKEQEKIEGEEKRVQSHLEVLMENSIHSLSPTQKARESPESESSGKETHGENSSVFSEMSTKTQKRKAENPQMDEEKRKRENKKQEEVKEKQETENLEGERRTKGKEGSLKCSSELCPQASEDKFVGVDSVKKLSSTGEGTKETGKQNPVTDNDPILADRTGVSQMVPVDDTERDKDVRQEEEEKKGDDAKADEEREEQVEQKNNDLLHSGVSDQNSLPNQLSLSQTAENKEDDQLYSREADNTELSDDNVLPQGDNTKSEDTETSSKGISTENETEQIHSDYMMNTVEDTGREEREINVKHEDVRVNQGRDVSTGGTVFRTEEGMEISVSSSDPVERQAVISEQTAPRHPSGSSHLSDGHNKGAAETGSAGAFGLFKNAFSFFTETKESPESAPSLDSDTGETAEQGRDSTTDSSHVHMQDVHTDPPITLSQQQLQPLFTETQTSSPSPTQTRSHPSESSIQKKNLTKHYKNLLIYMSAYETTIMMELFGRHKLQFLDYILGSSETTTDDPDNDESILLDIERLLRYHRETLVAPSMRLTDAPQEDKEKTTTLIALQKLEMLLARVRETFNTAKASCVGESCSSHSKDKEMATEEDPSVCLDNHTPRDKWMGLDEEKDGGLSGGAGKEKVTEDKTKEEKGKRSGGESVSPESCPPIQPGSPQSPEGVMNQILDFVHQIAEDSTTHVCAVRELLVWLTEQIVSTLPDDIRPGPDLYGVPWEPVIITSVVGLVTMLLFTCRCYSSVKSRMYRGKEQWMAEQVAQLLDEKCKVLETLSKCQQEYDDLESSLRDSGVLAQTQKTEHLEVKARQLEHAKRELDKDLEELKDQLDQQREHRIEQEKRIAVLEESMKTFEEETKDLQSQEEQAQTTLKVYNMNSDRLQRNLETAGEENTLLQESNAQLRQQVEGWAERVSELEAEMSRCEVAHGGMLQDVANKDERIMSLTDRLLSMKAWDSDLEEEEDEEGEGKEASNGTAGKGKENGRGDILDSQGHLQKVQKLIFAAKLNADLKSVDEDKDRLFAKLNDEVKAKEDLQARIEELDNEKLSLQSDTEQYSDQVQTLQQKLQIMTEMYQENELKLHRLLTVEEKERMQKEEKLNKADKNITMAMEELSNYRQRAGEMEEELEKTKQSYQTQISAHEKKAHNNWLAARAAERELADIRRENALFRQKLTDTQFKLDALDKDPYALDSLARPLPFRVSRGPVEPPGGHGEMERSGGPHSDSGSNSPTWERDRRAPPPGPPGLSGYMFPEQGGPMYRRPPPGALGLLPPPGPLHPRGLPPLPPHPVDMADGSYRENSHGPGEQEHRESGPGDRRTPPEMDPRMGGAPPPGPPMGPMDGPYPRRSPYGPPPPDFYPPRGPGGPTMMPMWAPPPPGMMFPPRFPPGGPPHPHFAPPMRPPFPDGHLHPSMGLPPPQQPLPSPPHSQSPEEHTPSPEDAI
ncbi:cTAGE family member 5 isoform X3 [Etheostoma spectabile]|uniref:cTAGE family member 5 isoform X3 n=1 Tax=Etheostoma spectabile TaxID=54343 RepID=UPI0013AEE7ED|nr:melanoma inhibitory activity protein 2 isoform X3 [Etheostoma spectabile]